VSALTDGTAGVAVIVPVEPRPVVPSSPKRLDELDELPDVSSFDEVTAVVSRFVLVADAVPADESIMPPVSPRATVVLVSPTMRRAPAAGWGRRRRVTAGGTEREGVMSGLR
jgi:hypothetical protein